MGSVWLHRLIFGALRFANAPYTVHIGATHVGRNSKAYSAEWGAVWRPRLTLGALRFANAPYTAHIGATRVGRNSKAYSAEWVRFGDPVSSSAHYAALMRPTRLISEQPT